MAAMLWRNMVIKIDNDPGLSTEMYWADKANKVWTY